jgi:hypothetical protein
MAPTYELIASNTLGSNAATVTFSAIPATYTDLIIKCSIRTNLNFADLSANITLNNDTASNYSRINLRGNGTAAASGISSNTSAIAVPNAIGGGTAITADTFNNMEIYVPNYTASTNKPVSIYVANENDATTAHLIAQASLWRDTAAITSIELEVNAITGSSFFLYGIKNS